MSSPATPKVTRAPTLPLVWVVPLIALAVGGWMIFREYSNHGPEITIEFADASGVDVGKTNLEYKGVAVGTVQNVELKKDLGGVIVHLRLKKNAASLAADGSQFWIIRPEIGLSGVRGIETLITGVHLGVLPGKGTPATEFKGLDQPPIAENKDKGRAFILQCDRLGAITPGAPVYFREEKVGEVETSQLSSDSTGVLIRIRVFTPYADLVRTNTKFWNAGGISLKVGLFGAEIKSTSLESLLDGGVAFATPEGALETAAQDGAQFPLNADADKDWLKWQQKIPIRAPEAAPVPPARETVAPLVH